MDEPINYVALTLSALRLAQRGKPSTILCANDEQVKYVRLMIERRAPRMDVDPKLITVTVKRSLSS